MHSYLIIAPEDIRPQEMQKRLDAAHISPFDTITITQSALSIGIKDVREFIGKLQLTPSQGPTSAGVIPDASLLTAAAQQALLKTLEEPPEHVIIVIGVSQPNLLLETILSRCTIVTLKDASSQAEIFQATTPAFIDQLLIASSGNRLKLLSLACKTREDSRIFLSEAIILLRKKLRENPTYDTTHITIILKRLMTLYKVNQSSMNMQLLIESAFL